MENDITRSILKHMYNLNRYMGKHTDGLGAEAMTMHQLHALFFIQREQPITMRRLADELRIAPGSATLLVERLVEAGWVIRLPDPDDRRSVKLELSLDARQKLAVAMERRMQQAGAILNKLSQQDLKELDRILGLLESSQ